MPELNTVQVNSVPAQSLRSCGADSGWGPGLTFAFDEEDGKLLHFLRVCDTHLSTQLLQHFP